MVKRLLLGLSFFAFAFAVFAQSDSSRILISTISISGNQKTKEKIIFRELMFEKNTAYQADVLSQLVNQSRHNLLNTSLFHKADIEISSLNDSSYDVRVILVERWYLWPIPQIDIDERNFNVWWEHRSLDRLSAGVFLTQNNFRGRMEKLGFVLMAGYNQQYGLSYMAPYINRKKTLGVGFDFIWSGRHEVICKTLNDKQIFYKDIDEFVKTEIVSGISLFYRPDFFITHQFEIGYQRNDLAKGLLDSAADYSFRQNRQLQFLNMYYKLKIDHRDFKIYPLKGYYFDIELFKHGFGFKAEGGIDLLDLKTTMRIYVPLSKRLYFAAGLIGKVSNYQGQPYLLQKSLGYGRDFVRGYEYYVIDGRHYLVGKVNLKYGLFQDKVLKINKIKTEKFNTIPWEVYGNLFFDGGYVKRNLTENLTNTLPGKGLGSLGLGVDFTTYYDKVARFEFTVNRKGERGFYLHFIAPI